MNRRKLPYFPLYVQDFLTDEKLAQCSAEATGVYIRLLCLLHKSDPYGTIKITDKEKKNSDPVFNFSKKIGRQMPYDFEVVLEAIKELLEENVIQIQGDFLYQKRMILDAELSDKRAEAGAKGFKKGRGKAIFEKTNLENLEQDNQFAIAKPIANTTDFAQAKLIANTEYEIEIENENEFEIDNKKNIKNYNEITERNLNAFAGDSNEKTLITWLSANERKELNSTAQNGVKNDFEFSGDITPEKTAEHQKNIDETIFEDKGKHLVWKNEKNGFLKNEGFKYKICQSKNLEKLALENLMTEFVANIELKQDYKSRKDLQVHFTNFLNKKTTHNGTTQFSPKPKFADILKNAGTRFGELGNLTGKDLNDFFEQRK